MNFNDFYKKLKTFALVVLSCFVFASGWLLPGLDLAARANDYQQEKEYKYEYKPSQDYSQQAQSGIQDKVQETTKQLQSEVAKDFEQLHKTYDRVAAQVQATAENVQRSVQEKLGQTPSLETATSSIQAAAQRVIDSIKAFFNSKALKCC